MFNSSKMQNNYSKLTIITLIISLVNLGFMVPGGPVETRSFSNILPEVVMGFNIFLTGLAILSISLVYFMIKKQKWAYQLAGVVGLAFALVYILDLSGIFPVSLDPMPPLLFWMECIGLVFGVVLIYLSYKTAKETKEDFWIAKFEISKRWIAISILLLLFGGYVIYFATSAALS